MKKLLVLLFSSLLWVSAHADDPSAASDPSNTPTDTTVVDSNPAPMTDNTNSTDNTNTSTDNSDNNNTDDGSTD